MVISLEWWAGNGGEKLRGEVRDLICGVFNLRFSIDMLKGVKT